MRIADVYITGTGAYLPPRVTTQEAVERGWYEQESVETFGWESATVAGDKSAPDMAVSAVNQAVARSGLRPEDFHLLIHAGAYHQGPDAWSPPHYILRNTLDTTIPATGIAQGCNGFLGAIEMAVYYLRASDARTAAVVSCADNFGVPTVDRWHASIGTVFGDGAAAVVLSKRPGFARLLAIDAISIPEFEKLHRGNEALYPPAVTMGRKFDMQERTAALVEEFGSDAARVSDEVTASTAEIFNQVLREAGASVDDIKKVLHLGAGQIATLEANLKPLGLSADLGNTEFSRTIGHAGASDIGMQLNHMVETGGLAVGDHFLMLSTGPGIVVSAAVLQVIEPPAVN
jgi:3-oxoacyl-[acyl-carrier-protein] synthase-3